MLTKNFYSYMVAQFSDLQTSFTLINGTQKKRAGNNSGTKGFAAMLTQSTTGSGSKAAGVSFGAGTSPATAQDYKLDTPITEGLSIVFPKSLTYAKGASFEDVAVTYGVTNISSSEITIAEIGLTATMLDTGSLYDGILIDRTVLDAPITIPAGESKQITYTIRFNYGT